jgi:hypothetical protein
MFPAALDVWRARFAHWLRIIREHLFPHFVTNTSPCHTCSFLWPHRSTFTNHAVWREPSCSDDYLCFIVNHSSTFKKTLTRRWWHTELYKFTAMIVAHAKEMNDGPRLDTAHTARPFVFVPKTDKSRIEPRTSCNTRTQTQFVRATRPHYGNSVTLHDTLQQCGRQILALHVALHVTLRQSVPAIIKLNEREFSPFARQSSSAHCSLLIEACIGFQTNSCLY